MAKKLFQNYSFEFDKNETKVLSNFCKQAVSQMMGNDQMRKDVTLFNSIIDKLNAGTDEVKLTKLEKTRLALQLKENTKYVKDQMSKSWFLKRWLLKTMYNQYSTILSNHFSD